MKPWEKYRDRTGYGARILEYKSKDGPPNNPGYIIGFNAATEYWQGHINGLVESLEFYEDTENHVRITHRRLPFDESVDKLSVGEIIKDYGNKARQALEKFRKEMKNETAD